MSYFVPPLDRPYCLAWRTLVMMALETAVSPLQAHLIEVQFLFQRGSHCGGRGDGDKKRCHCIARQKGFKKAVRPKAWALLAYLAAGEFLPYARKQGTRLTARRATGDAA